jgi:hypothetical protein
MSEKELDEQIADAIDDLEEKMSQETEEEQISQTIMEKVEWENFPIKEYVSRVVPLPQEWVDRVKGWFSEADTGDHDLARVTYSWLRSALTNEAYRERRKARSKDPVRRLKIRLQKNDQKLKRLEDERRQIMAQTQVAAREKKARTARQEPPSTPATQRD